MMIRSSCTGRPVAASLSAAVLLVLSFILVHVTQGSSHMDAPAITLDPAANTTDVYAFRSAANGSQYLTTAVAVYPFEEPGIGPNKYNFDDDVLYEIHIALGDGLTTGEAAISYQFRFQTSFKNTETILQSFLGVIDDVDDASQNLTQTYTVTRIDRRTDMTTILGEGVVPPNNQGIATPRYNQQNNGERPAKPGVSDPAELDRYTTQGIIPLANGYRSFAGQRDDGFYGDIQAIFDLLSLRAPGQDAQGGYNVHTIVLDIPLDSLGGSEQVAGVYATTSRQRITRREGEDGAVQVGEFVQVGRQGNPLFAEALLALADKDSFNQTAPTRDMTLFQDAASTPELAVLINAILFGGSGPAIETGRADLAGIYIPDLIKVDLSTGPARLAGPPDDEGFSRLSVYGGDVLTSSVQPGLPGFPTGTIPGGWPNGRRFGDDVVDIAVTTVISDLRGDPLVINGPAGDNVNRNDISYNKVFPYAATPLNGRRHGHHGRGAVGQGQTLFFAQFGNGGGAVPANASGGLSSDIVLTNTSNTTAVAGTVQFTDGDGMPLSVGLSMLGEGIELQGGMMASSVDFSLPASGTLTIGTDGLGDLAVGSAEVTADGVLGGVTRFSLPGFGIAGILPSQPVGAFTVPVRRTGDGINTGVAIRNTGDGPVTLTLSLVDSQGQTVSTETITDLAGNGHLSRFIDVLFPNFDTSAGFSGSMIVVVSGGQVAATALEMGLLPGEFTALPITPLG